MRVKCQNIDKKPTIKVGFQAIAISFLLGDGHLVRTLANIVFNKTTTPLKLFLATYWNVKKQNDEYSCNLDIAPSWAWMYVYPRM